MLTKTEIKLAEDAAREVAKVQSPMTNAAAHDDIAMLMLGEMFADNCRLAVKMREIGDTASARRMLFSAMRQLEQIEMFSKPTTKPQPTIEV